MLQGINQTSRPRQPVATPERHVDVLGQFSALQAFGTQRQAYQETRRNWQEQGRQRPAPVSDSRGPGIAGDARMNFQNAQLPADNPQIWRPPAAAQSHFNIAHIRQQHVNDLASQLPITDDLRDPSRREALAAEARAINTVRNTAAVAAATMPSADSNGCVICLNAYIGTDTVSTARCNHHSTPSA